MKIKNKRFIAFILSVVLILSQSLIVFADDSGDNDPYGDEYWTFDKLCKALMYELGYSTQDINPFASATLRFFEK